MYVLRPKRHRRVTRTAPELKINVFCKCYVDVVKTQILINVCQAPIKNFRKSRDVDNVFARFKRASCFQHRRFSWFFNDPDDFERKIRVDVANDFCHEEYSEYMKVQLFVPGGMPLIGEHYNAVIRIDDDDHVHLNNVLNKDYCSSVSGMGGPLVVGGDETFRRAHETTAE